jgi:hypothetical protein
MYQYIFIIILILQIITYYYIRKLNSCDCSQALGKTDKANIQYLEYIFIFFIIVSIINILYIFGVKSPSYLFINYAMIYTILLVIIHALLIVHTYRLYRNMPNDCECALKWPRYYLYFTTLIASINVFLYIVFIITFIYGFTTSFSKSFSNSYTKTIKKYKK